MLTETEARELLERAAATIEVAPGAPLALPPRRRWVPAVVAAAAVLAAVVVGVVVVDRPTESPAPGGPQPTSTTPPPSPPAPPTTDPAARALAAALLRFVDGDGPFPGNERVRFYSDGIFWNALEPDYAELRDSYSLCSGLAPPQCAASYLDGLGSRPGGYVVTDELPECFQAKRSVGEGRAGGSRTAYITNPAAVPCEEAWAIQIRFDAPDKLVAINAISSTPDPERDLRDLADRFIAFARGTKDTLPVDTPVRLYLDESLLRTLTAVQAEVRESYAVCPPGSGSTCVSAGAVELIRSVNEVPAIRRDSHVPACLERRPPVLTDKETGGSRSIVLTDIDHPCEWGVQLWFNDVDQLVAVDLRLKLSNRLPGPN